MDRRERALTFAAALGLFNCPTKEGSYWKISGFSPSDNLGNAECIQCWGVFTFSEKFWVGSTKQRFLGEAPFTVWAACRGGKVIRTVKFPCEKITSCCFGGDDFTDLYVTSSKHPMTAAELEATPLAVSKVTGLGVRGRKANMFSG